MPHLGRSADLSSNNTDVLGRLFSSFFFVLFFLRNRLIEKANNHDPFPFGDLVGRPDFLIYHHVPFASSNKGRQ